MHHHGHRADGLGRRVAVTGMAGFSPVGNDWETIKARLLRGENGIRHLPEWAVYEGLNTRLGAPVETFDLPAHYHRKALRSMGRGARMATRASELALEDAGLADSPLLGSGEMGIAYGASAGEPDAVADFGNMLINKSTDGLNANSYIRMMAHTAPVNIGVFLGVRGRIHTTSSACTSGSQGIGYAYEAIRFGRQKAMIAGGCEELSASEAAVFDTLFATSTRNDSPQATPRPFDRDRDGLVIGEGAGSLILEDLEHALARGAHIYAEVVGFGTNSDGRHVTQPDASMMEGAIRGALADAALDPSHIGYVSAHGTATDRGDVAESKATQAVFGKHQPISAFKSFTGHTLGACGALEAWVAIEMMRDGWFHPTLNLENPDPDCAELDYLRGEGRHMQCEYVMSNNFAFGGINTSLIFRRW
ncbi:MULTISPECIES: beta-ketoacyl-ACP synthase [Halomonas]|uniref:beta-ketoacyl-ACP synthase n=1 Tax=Halomonas TaxID=2745 RepID=UPI001A8F73B3|nr:MULTISPECIES: beta-ketoacyl-ACP synthase [Halomonas]MBN8413939.1 beta-ketoacyl-ACP synthase [Halomonas litopenaei]MED5294246.1 beta-ketoacyl-ACP synthase [Pseudomonadota bacterium]MBY5970194.1 beta-ketoacyl-ACP synthase [Halomonas denitrificans]MBY5985919.1 beta-ketoacyl-ACP synthase [Halomonas sp. DP5Y7-2]MBY6027951.1 beta-ketoacyl-ACP synthase [Halomonas sp. DP8Y7-1]